jgi:preprotein translocase subunit SecA
LGEIHRVDSPELSDIVKSRKEPDERQKDRQKELNELDKNYREKKEPGALENRENIVPFKRDTLKVGRNEPCLCGSGKKYTKCCLNKIN